jgi:hypothetical protein
LALDVASLESVSAVSTPASSVPPLDSAPAEDEASEPPELALDPAFADAEAPSPLALASALEFELADPPPALLDELLCDSALALAASAVISLKLTLISGTSGIAISANATTLADTISPNRKFLGRCIGYSPQTVSVKVFISPNGGASECPPRRSGLHSPGINRDGRSVRLFLYRRAISFSA